MSKQPSEKEEEPQEAVEEEASTKKEPANRIIILEERDIPFEEERPPNFSPHFAVKVHRVRKHERKEELKE